MAEPIKKIRKEDMVPHDHTFETEYRQVITRNGKWKKHEKSFHNPLTKSNSWSPGYITIADVNAVEDEIGWITPMRRKGITNVTKSSGQKRFAYLDTAEQCEEHGMWNLDYGFGLEDNNNDDNNNNVNEVRKKMKHSL